MGRSKVSSQFEQQALVFTKYLIKQPATPEVIDLYRQAMDANASKLDNVDQKILNFIERHPATIGFVDAGLVYYKSHSEIRRRLYVMLAILEASPQYFQAFAPKNRSKFYWFNILLISLGGIFKTTVGSVLVRVIA